LDPLDQDSLPEDLKEEIKDQLKDNEDADGGGGGADSLSGGSRRLRPKTRKASKKRRAQATGMGTGTTGTGGTGEEMNDSEVDWTPRWDKPPAFKLQPLATATLTLDFRGVPAGFEYNEHYGIILLGLADEAPIASGELEREEWQKQIEGDQRQQLLPDYFNARNDEALTKGGARRGTVKRAILELKLFNQ